MKNIYSVFVIFILSVIIFLLINNSDADTLVKHRPRRYLSFKNNSKFFLRMNFKANMVPWNQIFAQAVGFRLNWDEPPDTFHPYKHLRVLRSTFYDHFEILLKKSGLDGRQCIRRAICEMKLIAQPRTIYHTILKIIFRETSSTASYHDFSDDECRTAFTVCPLSFLEVSLYTDL